MSNNRCRCLVTVTPVDFQRMRMLAITMPQSLHINNLHSFLYERQPEVLFKDLKSPQEGR